MNALAPISGRPLQPIAADEARTPLLLLFSAYPEPYSDRNAGRADEMMAARVSAYMLGLDGLPSWCIEQAVKDFIQGRVDRSAGRRGKLPTVEEVSSEARIHLEREASRQRAERSRRDQIEERKSDFSDTHRDRMKFKMNLLSAAWCSPSERIDRLAEANAAGMDELMALAQEWNVPIPESLWSGQ